MKKFLFTIASLVLTASSFLAFGQAGELPTDPAVRKGKLDNGLTYYIRHNEIPEGRAEFYLATDVGAIQETPDQDGLAHFLEHMCFNGTKNFPDKGILDYLQSIGASFGGNVNASTGVEQTVYMLNNIPLVNQTVIDTCILIMHDYAYYVTNDPAEIDKERDVILEEKRYRDSGEWRLQRKAEKIIYEGTKYADCSIIGTEEQLKTFKPESLHNFYKTWYHPDMQALIVVGDVDVDYVEQKIKDIFGEIPSAVDPKAKDVIKIPEFTETRVGILTDPELSRGSVNVLWESEPLPEEYNNTAVGFSTDIVKSIICDIARERLSDLAAKPDCPFINANLGFYGYCETMEAVEGSVTFKEGKAVEAFNALMLEIEKIKRFGFTDDEVERAKEELLSQYETSANKADTRKNSQLVYELIYNFFDNTPYMAPKDQYELAKMIIGQGINAQVLNQVLPTLFPDKNTVIIYRSPEKEGIVHPTEQQLLDVFNAAKTAEIEQTEGEKIEKDFLDPSALKAGKVKSESDGLYGSKVWNLSNGVKVILYPSELEKDRIMIRLEKEGGSSTIPVEDMPSFDSNILALFNQNSGISRFPATTVGKMLSGKQVSTSFGIGEFRQTLSANSTVKDIETAFQMLHLMVTDPRFDKDEYDKGINTIKAILPNLVSQPDFKLQEEVAKTIYVNKERNEVLSDAILEKASLETLEKHYRRLFCDAAGATLYIAGDFDPEAIKPLVETYVASLPADKKAEKWIDNDNDIKKGKIVNDFKAVMNTPQTTVADIYTAYIDDSYANEVALSAVSYIMDMRYTTSLREEEGGTYGASTMGDLSSEPEPMAMFQIFFKCNPDKADKLRELATKGLNELAENGPTAEEFTMAINNIKKNIPERRVNNSYWLSCLLENEHLGRDRDKGYEAAAEALTAEAVQAMAKTIVSSGNYIELIMRPQVEE